MSLLETLRQETRSHHERIERVVNLVRDDVSVDEVRGVLRGFYGYYRRWEPRAGRALPADLRGFFESRRKVGLLADDLRLLGADDRELARLPEAPETADLSTLDGVLGSMYVLEGSTLGGQVIARHIRRMFPEFEGLRYFGSYGDRVGTIWREFKDVAGSRAEDPARVVAAAKATFDTLADWMLEQQTIGARA